MSDSVHELEHLIRAALNADAKSALMMVRLLRETLDSAERSAVLAARQVNMPWDTIGNLLGRHASHLIEKYPED